MKVYPKKRTLQRYMKFYYDMTNYPMLVFLGGSMGNVTAASNRMCKLKAIMCEHPDVAKKVVVTVFDFEGFFMQ